MPMSRKTALRRWTLMVTTIGIVVASGLLWTGGGDEASRGLEPVGVLKVEPPESLDDLTAHADLIVLGSVGEIRSIDRVFPAGFDASEAPEGIDVSVPFTNFALKVDEYVLGSGPAELVLRLIGDALTAESSFFRMPQADEPALLFLTREPARGEDVYGLYFGSQSRLVTKDGRVVFDDAQQSDIPFEAENLGTVVSRVRDRRTSAN